MRRYMIRYGWLIGWLCWGCSIGIFIALCGYYFLNNQPVPPVIEVLSAIGMVFVVILLIAGFVFAVFLPDKLEKNLEYKNTNCAKCNTEVSESDKTFPKCGIEFA